MIVSTTTEYRVMIVSTQHDRLLNHPQGWLLNLKKSIRSFTVHYLLRH
jgi:hypothetical protein